MAKQIWAFGILMATLTPSAAFADWDAGNQALSYSAKCDVIGDRAHKLARPIPASGWECHGTGKPSYQTVRMSDMQPNLQGPVSTKIAYPTLNPAQGCGSGYEIGRAPVNAAHAISFVCNFETKIKLGLYEMIAGVDMLSPDRSYDGSIYNAVTRSREIQCDENAIGLGTEIILNGQLVYTYPTTCYKGSQSAKTTNTCQLVAPRKDEVAGLIESIKSKAAATCNQSWNPINFVTSHQSCVDRTAKLALTLVQRTNLKSPRAVVGLPARLFDMGFKYSDEDNGDLLLGFSAGGDYGFARSETRQLLQIYSKNHVRNCAPPANLASWH